MLQQYFVVMIIMTFLLLLFLFTRSVLRAARFINISHGISVLYNDAVRELLNIGYVDFAKNYFNVSDEQIEQCAYLELKYQDLYVIRFSNTREAFLELEKIIQEATKIYNKMGIVSRGIEVVQKQNVKLEEIKGELRVAKWLNGGWE